MPYKTPKHIQERKNAKKKHILNSALKIFASKGYNNTNMKDILTEADISVGSFYFYFSSKDELFENLYDDMNEMYLNVISDALEDIFQNPVQSICKAITLALWSFQRNRELAKIMLIEAVGLNPHFEQKRKTNNKRFSRILEEILGQLNDKGIINAVDVNVAAIALMGSVYTLIIDWLQEDSSINPVEFAYPLTIYNIQALKMEFNHTDVKNFIDELLKQDFEEIMGV